MTTIFTVKRDEHNTLVALVLADRSTRPTIMNGPEATKELQEFVRESYGHDAAFVPGSQFQRELEQRQVHTPEIVAMLEHQRELFGVDASSYVVYGSPMRPMSSVWARIQDAMFIPSDRWQTGYHTYVAVPRELDREVIDNYELQFVSHAK